MKMSTSMPLDHTSDPRILGRRIRDLELAGVDIVWMGEGYGFDVPSAMGYLAAVTETIQMGSSILNVFSRTPAALAQTAAGVDWLSGGRAILGLGASGPQVIEGFHGVPFDRPVRRTKEVIEVCRAIWRRERVQYHGAVLELPLPPGEGRTGMGIPVKLVHHPVRERIPIWWASLGPVAVEATAECADGWLPLHLIPEKLHEVWGDQLDRGHANRPPDLGALEIGASATVAIGDDVDVEAVYDSLRPGLALYVGGMGARGKNFYNDLAKAYGYHDEAELVQELFLDGKRDAAAAAIPADWLEKKSLVGPKGHVKERLAVMKDAGVTTLGIDARGPDELAVIATIRELIDEL